MMEKTVCCAPTTAARHAGQVVRETVAETAQKAREAVGAVEAKFQAAERRAKEAVARGRQAVGACETAFKDKVRARPLAAMLLAAAVGVVVGMTAALLLRRRNRSLDT